MTLGDAMARCSASAGAGWRRSNMHELGATAHHLGHQYEGIAVRTCMGQHQYDGSVLRQLHAERWLGLLEALLALLEPTRTNST